MFKHKKAVSPLIATVLLIAFAVALGAVVMNWGRGYVEDTAQVARQKSDSEVKCTSDVDIDFVSIDNTPQVCYNISDTLSGTGNDTIFFVLENKKDVYIRKIQARLIGGTSRTPLIVDLGNYSEMTGVQAKLFNLTYSESLGSPPSQLKLIPTIRSGGQDVTCAANGRTAIDILPCERVFGDG
jgi:flagellin-like protein